MYRSSWTLVAALFLVGTVGADLLLSVLSGKSVPVSRKIASLSSVVVGGWFVAQARRRKTRRPTTEQTSLPPAPDDATTAKRPTRVAFPEATALLAVGAVLLTLFSVSFTLWRNPPWGRLGSYDFSTPEAALRAYIRMDATCDIVAERELRSKFEQKGLKEFRDSVEVKRTREFNEKQAAFVQCEKTDSRTGRTRETRVVLWFEKDKASGYWIIGSQPEKLSAKSKKLDDEIKAWEKSSLLDRAD